MSYEYTEITDDTFFGQTALVENGMVFVYKDPCPNCKAMKKVVEKFMADHPDVRILQMDSEANPQTMVALEVAKVPSFFILRQGQVTGKKTGLMNIREFSAFYAGH